MDETTETETDLGTLMASNAERFIPIQENNQWTPVLNPATMLEMRVEWLTELLLAVVPDNVRQHALLNMEQRVSELLDANDQFHASRTGLAQVIDLDAERLARRPSGLILPGAG